MTKELFRIWWKENKCNYFKETGETIKCDVCGKDCNVVYIIQFDEEDYDFVGCYWCSYKINVENKGS